MSSRSFGLFALGRALALVAAAAPAAHAAPGVTIQTLRAEAEIDPIGIDTATPRLAWILDTQTRGQRQTAYHVLAARKKADLAPGRADLWDSGKIASDQSVGIAYGGKRPLSGERVYWKVRVWDKDGLVSYWSQPAFFEVGLLRPEDHTARWIGLAPAPARGNDALASAKWIWCGGGATAEAAAGAPERCQFRATFELPAGRAARRAEWIVGAAGEFQADLNGRRLGAGKIPGQALVLDAREWLTPGKNVLAITAARAGTTTIHPGAGPAPAGKGGAGAHPAVIARFELELAGDAPIVRVSDRSWKANAPGERGARGGETDGGRGDRGDFRLPTFDDAAWPAAEERGAFGDPAWKDTAAKLAIVRQENPAPYLRKAFTIKGAIERARLYATALGAYEARLNGKKVGDAVLAPGFTDFSRRVEVQTYDVTSMVRPGENVVGAILGDGWYAGKVAAEQRHHHLWGPGPARFWAQLDVTTKDGQTTRVATDGTWRARTGAVLTNDVMDGETHDARRELAGWDVPGFRGEPGGKGGAADRGDLGAGAWRAVDVFDEARNLVPQAGPFIRVTQDLKPRAVREVEPGVHVFDLGQNMVGWVRLRARAPAGTTATLRFAEMLNPDGTIYTANLRAAKATDRYTFRGDGVEEWEPRFTFHGFRYVELTGLPGKPDLATGMNSVTGRVVHSDMRITGRFATSHPLVNQLQSNIVWSQRGNFLSVPTDCPQRDERLGWTGDTQIFARTACFNMDVQTFFKKWMRDMTDVQSPDGAFQDQAPRPGRLRDSAPAWGDAGVIVPWTMYQCYGDRAIVEESYPAMKRWVDFVRGANPDLLWTRRTGPNYGDWLSIDSDTDKDVLATAYFAQSARLLAKMAAVLGKQDDARDYDKLADEIAAAFGRAYVAKDGRIKSDTQTAYLLALRFGLLPEAARAAAGRHLVANIERHRFHLTTGFLGVGHLLPGLTLAGRDDVAYRLLLNETYPSWGYSIKQGATTIWERWDGWTHDRGFQTPGMNSFNHYSMGSAGEWMYARLGGVDTDPEHPGFKRILIRPQPGGGLTHARTELDSVHGPILSSWQRHGDTFQLVVAVPVNTTAEVTIPFGGAVTESGKPLASVDEVKVLKQDAGEIVVEVGSGRYNFALRGVK